MGAQAQELGPSAAVFSDILDRNWVRSELKLALVRDTCAADGGLTCFVSTLLWLADLHF